MLEIKEGSNLAALKSNTFIGAPTQNDKFLYSFSWGKKSTPAIF